MFRIGHLGDALVALPALWALRDSFPDARVTLLSNSDLKNPHYVSARNVLPEKGLIDSWLSYPNSATGFGAVRAFSRLALQIRREGFDAMFYLMPRGRTRRQIARDKAFFRFAGIPEIFCTEYAAANSLPSQVPKPAPEVRSECDFLIDCLRSEGIWNGDKPLRADLLLSEVEISAAQKWLDSAVPESDRSKPLLAVAPGSKWPSKTWDESRFGEVVLRLIERYAVFPIVFGGEEDRGVGNRLLSKWETGANAAGNLNVREAAAAIARCRLYLGNDTGTMHLAAFVGTPCVAVFSAIDWPGRWYPFGPGHRVFRRTVECEGCHVAVSFNGNKCLDLIGVDEVYEGCVETMEESRKRQPGKDANRSNPVLSKI